MCGEWTGKLRRGPVWAAHLVPLGRAPRRPLRTPSVLAFVTCETTPATAPSISPLAPAGPALMVTLRNNRKAGLERKPLRGVHCVMAALVCHDRLSCPATPGGAGQLLLSSKAAMGTTCLFPCSLPLYLLKYFYVQVLAVFLMWVSSTNLHG